MSTCGHSLWTFLHRRKFQCSPTQPRLEFHEDGFGFRYVGSSDVVTQKSILFPIEKCRKQSCFMSEVPTWPREQLIGVWAVNITPSLLQMLHYAFIFDQAIAKNVLEHSKSSLTLPFAPLANSCKWLREGKGFDEKTWDSLLSTWFPHQAGGIRALRALPVAG